MRKCYSSLINGNCFFGLLALIFSVCQVNAQTTLTTLPNPPYNASNGAGANAAVTFVIENTNGFAVLLNNVSTWLLTTDASATLQLWYSATSLSGAPAIATPAWTQIAQVTNFPAPATSGITPVWSNLGFSIPAGTQYRFAVWYVNVPSHYSGTGAGTVTPSTFSGGGVNLKLGDVQIAGANVGYGGANNPRWWTGEITFQPAGPCVNPPVPGTITSTATTACLNIPFTVSTTGGTGGTGQTYQWEISTDNITFTPIAGQTGPTLNTSQTTSHYYRVVVTCGVSVTSSSILVNTPNAVSGTYTINSALPTGGTNFQSFNSAYDYIKCGINGPVVFNVDAASGPYTEQLIMTPVPGASATNTVTFNGNGRTLQFLSTNTNERAVIKLNGADHIKFNNLVINALGTATTDFGYGIHMTNDADSNMVNGCSININTTSTSTTAFAGIVMSATATSPVSTGNTLSDGNVITNNRIDGGSHGITCVGSATAANRDNIISGNTVTNAYSFGIYILGNFNTLVDSNTVSRPTRTVVGAFSAIYLTNLNISVNITRNTITDPYGGAPASTTAFNGIFITGVDALAGVENKVINNRIYNITGAGEANGINNTGSDNVWYQHNSILMDGTGGTALTRAFYQTTLAAGIRFENNIISITRGGTGAKYGLYHNTVTSDIFSNKNDIYLSPLAGNTFIGFYNATAQLTLPNWQTASGGDDVNSITSNPLFLNASTGDLAPTNASIDNLGNPLGVLIDINGQPRSLTTPDLGAYEFTPGPCAAPPVAGTASATPTPLCVNNPVSLSLTGNSIGLGQTYQWQVSPTIGGPYTNIGNVLTNPDSVIISSVTQYYQVAVTCGSSTVTSTPVLVTVNPALPAGTYTINNALPTAGTNYNSFNDARIAMNCGIAGAVVFNVDAASGPYTEQLILTPIAGASAINTVTFNGNGRTLQFLSTNTNERAVIKLNGADHIKFNDLVINALGTATTDFGFGVHMTNDADSNMVNNCVININTTSTSTTNFAGIVISATATSPIGTGNTLSDGNVITNNRIDGGSHGITCVGSGTSANRDNIISGNTVTNSYSFGIYILGNFNTLVDSNTVSRPTRTAVGAFSAIYMTNLNVSVNITRNTITDPYGGAPASTTAFNGIFITGVDALSGVENKVINNRFYNITGAGEANAINNTGSDNVWYQHNSILMDGTGGTALTRGFYQTTTAAGVRFENNIISIIRGGTGAKYALYHNTPASDIFSNKNDLYLSASAGNTFIGFINATAQLTLINWQTATAGDDINSITANPLFASAVTGDLRPTSTSVNDLGTPLGVLIDILGQPRSLTTPDMGAYEFTPGPCVAPPTGGTASAAPTPLCVNNPVSLALSGNSIGLGQTYQWQTSAALSGPYTNIGNPMPNPDTTIISSVSQYYQVAVTCGSSTVTSTPVLVVVNPALPGGNYTIDLNNPTVGTNYNNFNDAKAAMLCGITGPVVFNVVSGSGPYNEQLVLDSIAGASAVNTVTFNGNGNTIAFSSSDNAERAVIKLRRTDHIIFNNLTIDATGAGTFGYGVQLINNADSNTIFSCNIIANTTATNTNFAGIVMNSVDAGAATVGNTWCDANEFVGNTINGGYYGITLVGNTAVGTLQVRDNRVTNNTIEDFYFYGIYMSGNSNTLVESNNISRPLRTPVTTCYGVYSTGFSEKLKISKNRISNPFGGDPANTSAFAGVYFTGTDATAGNENVVSNNLVYGITGAGIQYGINNNSSNGARYYHNTISLEDNIPSTTTSATYGFFQTLDANEIEFKNNIITISRANTGNKFGLNFATATSVITSNNNDLYLTGTNTFTGFSNGLNRITLGNWQAATSQDASSVSFNPLYANTGSGNYAPTFPPMDNLGTPVGITTDILNAPRSATTPDMGAYEFAIPPCSAPPVAGNATANPTSGFCLETPIDLSLTGYFFGGGQTYQWEFSTSATGPWSPLGGVRLYPDTTILASGTYFYRCQVSCSGNTTISTTVQVTMNPAFLGGFYTINKNLPAVLPNFQSFNAAVAAMDCGITDFVTFDVAPDTYTEQVRMRYIPGSSLTKRVTFRSANGNPASVILTWDAVEPATNYVLKLDSAKYITYKDMTITAINATNGRAIELANTASYDSITNCQVNVEATTLNTTAVVGIFANPLRGSFNVIKGNTISNGTTGIYINGPAANNLVYDNVIDSNTIVRSYSNGIYIGLNGRVTVSRNTVNLTMPRNATNYGIYSTGSDSAFKYLSNKINIDGITAGTTYGMYFTGCDGSVNSRGRIAGNTVLGLTGNTGTLYGIYQTASTFTNTVNNVVSINTTGANSWGSYVIGGSGNNFHNNTIVSTATSATNNIAAYFAQTTLGQGPINIQNNIFNHDGGGKAMQMTNLNFNYSNYNTFYTTGPTLIQGAAVNYANLQSWRDAVNWDYSSMSGIKPALVSTADPRPDLTSPEVWAIHGRGNQIPGNDYDFNNDPRPTTFTAGVPDMGAYEFLPTSQPTVLTATPAVPAPGMTQVFTYGTDTVIRITYDATAPVPPSISLKRFSGVLPTGLTAGQNSMYFYNAIDVPSQGAYKYNIDQFYVDSWRGFIPTEQRIRMGRTNAASLWEVGPGSSTDIYSNDINDTALSFIDRYTGLEGDPAIIGGGYTTVIDTSNRGTRFWVPYGNHYSFDSNGQDMWLYLSAEDSANVTVRVNGTSWKRVYAIPANTVRVSDIMPKSGLVDARILAEGLYEHGISITSDVPIVAYAHIYDGATSGASMLLPVGVYGYSYQSLNARQYYANNCYSWTSVISDRDSTLVEITPAVTTRNGNPANVPYTVLLMRGQVYNFMGTVNGSAGTDLSGSKIRSIANASGKCYPIAVFSGSTRTAICNTSNGDNMIQQVFPAQAWGKKYLTFATANSTSNTLYNSNVFRVMVKDPTTVVSLNGTALPAASLVVPGSYYEFNTTQGNGTNGAIYVEADKPVMVAQYMVSTGAFQCAGVTATGQGDPELIYISPIEQGIKKVVFYNTQESAITNNYINLVLPTSALASLTIDGGSTFTDVFAHPFLTGYTCVRHNLAAAAGQHIAICDSAFTAITYGLGSVESYGYNAGTLVKNLNALPNIVNTLGSAATSDYTCVDAPFRFNILITAQPQQLTWQFSAISDLVPNTDVVQVNPVPIGTFVINGRTFYKYTVAADYRFTAPGTYYIPILVKDTSTIEGCDNTQEIILEVKVLPAPVADFSAVFSGCFGAPIALTGTGTTANGTPISTYNWDFGNTITATGQTTSYTYPAPGTYNITLNVIAQDGCIGDTTKPITINPAPEVLMVKDSLAICRNTSVTFEVLNPVTGSVYEWFTTASGGTPVFTGTTYTIPAVSAPLEFFVQETSAASCISLRKRVVASILPDLLAPAVVSDSIVVCGNDPITFEILNPVAGSTYDWFTTPTGGTPVFTGTSYNIPSVTGTIEFYVQETNANGCISATRTKVAGYVYPDLDIPVARVDSVYTDRIKFAWDAITGAVGYEVSIDNGTTWITPSSGSTGLTHMVTGLQPLDEVTLIVRALGQVSCQTTVSAPVTGKTLPDQIYIPNTFTPNGDGLNDVLLVYGYIIKSMKFVVFNQWGEKIFESNNQSIGWNGTYKGKLQPSGVYMYVCQLNLTNGTTQVKKGSINLVR